MAAIGRVIQRGFSGDRKYSDLEVEKLPSLSRTQNCSTHNGYVIGFPRVKQFDVEPFKFRDSRGNFIFCLFSKTY